MKILSSKDKVKALQKEPELFVKIFNNVGSKNRAKEFNRLYKKEFIEELSNIKYFNKAIRFIVMEKELDKFRESLLRAKNTPKLCATKHSFS